MEAIKKRPLNTQTGRLWSSCKSHLSVLSAILRQLKNQKKTPKKHVQKWTAMHPMHRGQFSLQCMHLGDPSGCGQHLSSLTGRADPECRCLAALLWSAMSDSCVSGCVCHCLLACTHSFVAELLCEGAWCWFMFWPAPSLVITPQTLFSTDFS